MNKPTVTGVTLAAVLAVLGWVATNGKAFADGMMAVWLFFVHMSETAPMGLSSFLMAMALAVGAQAAVARWMPLFKCATSRDLVTDLVAFAVGFVAMWAQMPNMKGIMLGTLAGFVSPYVFKSVTAVGAMVLRRWKAREIPDAGARQP